MKDIVRVLACSPRQGGNTDLMSGHFARGVSACGGKAEILYLRDYTVLPCTSCRVCEEDPEGKCRLAAHDDVETLFAQIEGAALLCIVTPIFFYHLPAQLKALIDRSQRLWARRRRLCEENPLWMPPAPKPAMTALVAARMRGSKLFEGSLLTLQYFLDILDSHIVGGCKLLGYEQPQQLADDALACAKLYELGLKAAASAAQSFARE